MNLTEDHDLLHYYVQELAYLRRAGVSFAQRYPKVAARLELSENESPDPHVERLIEAFALLSGRIQYNIDSEFPIFTTAMLDNLYPHYTVPQPSMSIAQFDIDPEQGMLIEGHVVPEKTALFTQATDDITCRFRTCYPVTLWPINIESAQFDPTSRYDFLDTSPDIVTVLRLRIQHIGSDSMDKLALDSVRFHLHGMWLDTSQLYELLFCNLKGIGILGQDEVDPIMLPTDALQAVGFEEEVIPYHQHAHPAYRLLQEYFAFPEKFMFFDISSLEKFTAKTDDTYFDILFMLDKRPEAGLNINADHFRLGCTPIINLFSHISEPLRLDHRKTEYRITPDIRRESATEIHSILRVSATPDETDETTVLQPYFSFRHHMEGKEHNYFWASQRRPAERADLAGTEIFMSFVDLNFDPFEPATDTLYAHTLCTNRHYAEQVPANAAMQIEAVAPLTRITCLNKPTPQRDPPMRGNTIWRLISHLSLNHLSLTDNSPESLTALRELLRLYQFSAPHKPLDRQVMGIRSLAVEQSVRRLGPDAWRGFVRGFEVTLEFDNAMYVGSSAFLLASVLNHFFPLYVSSNSFTRLIIKNKQKEGVWKKWQPRVGKKWLL